MLNCVTKETQSSNTDKENTICYQCEWERVCPPRRLCRYIQQLTNVPLSFTILSGSHWGLSSHVRRTRLARDLDRGCRCCGSVCDPLFSSDAAIASCASCARRDP